MLSHDCFSPPKLSGSILAIFIAILLVVPATTSSTENQDTRIVVDSGDSEHFGGGVLDVSLLSEAYMALVNYSDVLVIRNLNSADSMTIADYFTSQRNISWAHVCNVTTSLAEQIDATTFDALDAQVRACLNALPPGMVINFLVTTKGVPLKTWRSYTGDWWNARAASVDSELALIDGPYRARIGQPGWFQNPYCNTFAPFTRMRWGFYIVTRLTAFTVPEALGLVDRAAEAIGRRGRYVLDVDPGKDGGGYQIGNNWMRFAEANLTAKGFDVTLDETSAFLTNYSDVAGYFSWGSNDGAWYAALDANPGFELDADTNGVPDGWFYDDPGGTATITRNATVRESGSWSLNITRAAVDANATYVSTNVSLLPERRYFVTGSVNYTNVTGGRGMYLQLRAYDSVGSILWVKNGTALTGTSGWRGLPQVIYEPVKDATKLVVSFVFAEANGTAYVDNVRLIEIRPHNRWIPGALAETAVSTGGRTFNYDTGYGQSLVADLIRDGVTGVKGYVYEPYLDAIAHADVLFNAYTQGYNLAESYMMASEWGLSWMDAIIGDPKLASFNRSYIPDLLLTSDDIVFSSEFPQPGDIVGIDATVHNVGHFPVENATISFYLGDPRFGGSLLGNRTIMVKDGSAVTVSVQLDTTGLNGWYDVCAFADSPNDFYELDESNNIACSRVGVTTSYTLHLEKGRRLVSFPVHPANDSIQSVLSSISGCYDYVRWYDSVSGTSEWKSYLPGRSYSSLLHLGNTMGFWINMTSSCDLVVNGVRPTSTITALYGGWNLVGFPSFNSTYTIANLKADMGLARIIVEVFDATAAPFYLQRASESYVMGVGEGYWVYVPSDASWHLHG